MSDQSGLDMVYHSIYFHVIFVCVMITIVIGVNIGMHDKLIMMIVTKGWNISCLWTRYGSNVLTYVNAINYEWL